MATIFPQTFTNKKIAGQSRNPEEFYIPLLSYNEKSFDTLTFFTLDNLAMLNSLSVKELSAIMGNGLICNKERYTISGGKFQVARDGQKFVCLDFLQEGKNCIIYSFGLNGDWTFEEEWSKIGKSSNRSTQFLVQGPRKCGWINISFLPFLEFFHHLVNFELFMNNCTSCTYFLQIRGRG